MGLFGGLFESSSSAASTSTVNTTTVDKRVVADGGSTAVSGDTVNLLDAGAIDKAFSFAAQALGAQAKLSNELASGAQSSLQTAVKAYDSARGDGTLKFILGVAAAAGVGVVAIFAWGRARK